MFLNHVMMYSTTREGVLFMVNIAELRARSNKMSQRELAEEMGVTQSQISRWEKDPLTMSSVNLVKVALFFGVTTDELLGVKQG